MRLLLFAILASAHGAPSRIVFPESRQEKKLEPITPPVLPVIPHLENDPIAERAAVPRHSPDVAQRSDANPRFGFEVSPTRDGGVTATFGQGFAGSSQSAAQSVSFGFSGGFQASQSSSSSGAFDNSAHGGISSSHANSQSASFSVGSGGVSAVSAAASAAAAGGQASAHSQSASFGVNAPNFGGNPPNYAVGSQSASSAFATANRFPDSAGAFDQRPPSYRPNSYSGRPGSSSGRPGFSSGRPGFSRPHFGEGSIDVRTRPTGGLKATSIVFPGTISRDSDNDDSDSDDDELISFDDRWLTGGRKGGLADWLSILVSD